MPPEGLAHGESLDLSAVQNRIKPIRFHTHFLSSDGRLAVFVADPNPATSRPRTFRRRLYRKTRHWKTFSVASISNSV
jgi:hypothetical protein